MRVGGTLAARQNNRLGKANAPPSYLLYKTLALPTIQGFLMQKQPPLFLKATITVGHLMEGSFCCYWEAGHTPRPRRDAPGLFTTFHEGL